MPLATYSAQSAISYKYHIHAKSQIIYSFVLLILIIALISLPFIKVQISINSPGVLQSSLEKTELTIPVNGRLIHTNLKDNQNIKQGDTLLVIDAALPKQQDALLQARIVQINQFIQDINALLNAKLSVPNLQTGQYSASWQQYIQEAKSMQNTKDQAERTYKRYEKLYQNGALTAAEYEKYKLEYGQAVSAIYF